MAKQTKLQIAVLAHLASLSEEDAVQFYGVKATAIKTAKRLKRPTAAMYETYVEWAQTGQAAPDGAVGGGADADAAQGTMPVAELPTNALLNDPVFMQVVEKLNEFIGAQAEHAGLLNQHEERLMLLEGIVAQVQARMFTTPHPVSARVPVGTLPPSSAGQPYVEPELVSSIRPNNTVAAVPVLFPTRAPGPVATPGVTIHRGEDFSPAAQRNWLDPHAPKK